MHTNRIKNTTYEMRYVAFLDILGFKNMVLWSAQDGQALETINKALDYISDVQRDNYEGYMPLADYLFCWT